MDTSVGRLRRADLDWLRVFAVLGVFLYHSLHFFDPADWSVKNGVTYPWVGWFMDLLALWIMPLIFVVSGASLFYAIRKGGAAGFVRDKALRLLVPLVGGVFTLSIIQVYVERVSHGQFRGSLVEFLPHYFDGVYVPGGTGNFAFHGMHLWSLLALFILTMVLLPLFWWSKGATGSRVVRRFGDLLALPGGIVLLAVPTVVLQNLTDAGMLGGTVEVGSWRPIHYLWFFLAGYLIVSHERVQERIARARWFCVGLVVIPVVLSLVTHTGLGDHRDLWVWPCLLGILGFGLRHMTRQNRFLTYANEAVLPFYILHQNMLLWVGFLVVRWSVPDGAKYGIIAVSSLATSLLLYQYVVRRLTVLRVLSGMKPLRPVVPGGSPRPLMARPRLED